MGRITDFTFAHPDEVLTCLGFAGGFGLATVAFDLWGGIAAGLVAALFTLVLSKIEPHTDPALGPHH